MGLVSTAVEADVAAKAKLVTDSTAITTIQGQLTAAQAQLTTDTASEAVTATAVYTALTTAPYTGTALLVSTDNPPVYQVITAVAPASYSVTTIPLG